MKTSRKSRSHAIDISEEAGVRFLHFGSDWVQGAMRIARPWSLELDYTREMMLPLLLRPDTWPQRVLLVGLGAGSLAKFLYRYRPDCRITAVEINPQVEFIARQYFKLPDAPGRLDVVIGCGADYVLSCRKKFDLVLVDGFDPEGHPGVLDTEPFLHACRACLSDDGLLGVNLLREKGYSQRLARIGKVFDGRAAPLPPAPSGNTIAFATVCTPIALPLSELAARADMLRKATRLDLRPTLGRLAASQDVSSTFRI